MAFYGPMPTLKTLKEYIGTNLIRGIVFVDILFVMLLSSKSIRYMYLFRKWYTLHNMSTSQQQLIHS